VIVEDQNHDKKTTDNGTIIGEKKPNETIELKIKN
jgi:hypothetical protein